MLTWQDVPGWFDWQDVYDEVALTTPPYSTIVEVGVGFGRSLLYLARRIKETGKDIRIAAVDPWPDRWWFHDADYVPPPGSVEEEMWRLIQSHGNVYEAFLYHLNQCETGLKDLIDIVRVPSLEAAAIVRHPHFVFLDGDHSAEAVIADIAAWYGSPAEWIAGHDYDRAAVRGAVDQAFGRRVEIRRGTTWIARRGRQ